MTIRVCIVTGSRAEYGLMYWLMKTLQESPDFELQVVATAMHLEPAFGRTVDLIRQDGFTMDAEVPMQLALDKPAAVARSAGLGTMGLAEAFDRLTPDVVVLLGDRFETLAAATAAALMRIPVAHIHGGEISEGAIDDALRHAVTKLSHLHFVAAEPFRRRVIQLGEAPEHVFTVGAPGVDNLTRMTLPDCAALTRRLGIDIEAGMMLLTYHPATLDERDPLQGLNELLAALDEFPDFALVFTAANADSGGRAINERIERYAADRAGRAVFIASLGQDYFLAALKAAAVIVGNSSAGLIEAPAAGTPTVNIGIRQQGRPRAASVVDCAERRADIVTAIRRALDPAMKTTMTSDNPPYGHGGNAAEAIVRELRRADFRTLLRKKFHDLPVPAAAASGS